MVQHEMLAATLLMRTQSLLVIYVMVIFCLISLGLVKKDIDFSKIPHNIMSLHLFSKALHWLLIRPILLLDGLLGPWEL